MEGKGGGGVGRSRACAVVLPVGNPARGGGASRAAGGGALWAAVAAAHCAAGAPTAGPWTGGFPGMVSKTLLRLVSAVNRRRMKLLLGIALLAYVACE